LKISKISWYFAWKYHDTIIMSLIFLCEPCSPLTWCLLLILRHKVGGIMRWCCPSVCLFVYSSVRLSPKTRPLTRVSQMFPPRDIYACGGGLLVASINGVLRPVYSDTTTTQLNSAQLNSTSNRRRVHSVNNCHLSMNVVVTHLTQFVGYDVINKNTTDLAVRCSTGSVEFSWVELCRYIHPFKPATLNAYVHAEIPNYFDVTWSCRLRQLH